MKLTTKVLALVSITLAASSLLTAGTPVPSSATPTSNVTYTWNPTGITDDSQTANMGGAGAWNYSTEYWWDGEANQKRGNNTIGLFGTTTVTSGSGASLQIENPGMGSIINFNGPGGIISRTYNTYFAAGSNNNIVTHTLNFAASSNYTITNAKSAGSIRAFTAGGNEIASGNAIFNFNVGAGASLNFLSAGYNATDTNPIGIFVGYNVTGSNGLNFGGPGTVNIGNNVMIRHDNVNSRIAATNSVTLNFNEGSIVSGGIVWANTTAWANTNINIPTQKLGVTAFNPLTGTEVGNTVVSINATRLAVLSDSTVNVNGSTLYVAYRGSSAPSTGAGHGILLGDAAGQGTVNLTSGTIKALGDPRNTGAAYGGISFGGVSAGTKGGEFNMSGGNLIVSNIRTSSAIENSRLIFNGGNVIVSTDVTPNGTQTLPTATELQSRLDTFIAGFANNSTNYVALGNNGFNLDTSAIDTSKTGGLDTVTITADIRNISGQNGTFTKIGAGGVRLTGNNSYTGDTNVNAGTLINDGTLTSNVTVAIGASVAGNGTFANIDILDTNASFDTTGFSAGNLHFATNLTINLDLTNAIDSGSSFITLDSLTAGGSTLTLNLIGTSTSDLAGYSLLSYGTTTLDPDTEILVTGDLNGLSYSLQNGQLVLGIPEPSTYALIAALALLTLALARRRK